MCKMTDTDNLEGLDHYIDSIFAEFDGNFAMQLVAVNAMLTAFVHENVEDPGTLLIANRIVQHMRNWSKDHDIDFPDRPSPYGNIS